MNSTIVTELREKLTAIKSLNEDQAHTMPAEYYTSEEFLDFEREHIFRKEWICLGRADELRKPGDFYTTEVLEEPLLVTRDNENTLRVLANVCRHRGNIVVTEKSGNKGRFSCAYHAWTYANDGSLLGAPIMGKQEGFDKSKCGLPEIASEIWQGFLYVNLDGKAKPLAPRIEGLIPYIENYDLADRVIGFVEEGVWKTNWKCLTENFMEGYHLDYTHPKTLRPITPTHLCERIPAGEGYNAYYSRYDSNTPERAPYPPKLTREEQRCSLMFGVYPGHVVGLAPNIVVHLCLQPVSADEVHVKWSISGVGDNPDSEYINKQVELMRQVNAEDRNKLETLQRGLKSRSYRSGPLAPPDLEGTIWDHYQYMARHLASDVELN